MSSSSDTSSWIHPHSRRPINVPHKKTSKYVFCVITKTELQASFNRVSVVFPPFTRRRTVLPSEYVSLLGKRQHYTFYHNVSHWRITTGSRTPEGVKTSKGTTRKEDLILIADELGEKTTPEMKVLDLKNLILNSEKYKNNKEFMDDYLDSIISNRISYEEQARADRKSKEERAFNGRIAA
ncbi:hypothetical protein TNCV_41391 [Trichonephila clavipes]|nr:hypothetical protein TNCV_41391 [Trichonephila clavipes]